MSYDKRIGKDEWDHLGWLHIYGQYTYHSEATIKGTREGLTALRDAITVAIGTGEGKASVIASDGEGYPVHVVRINTHAALGEPEYTYELEYEMGKREAERRAKIRASIESKRGKGTADEGQEKQ